VVTVRLVAVFVMLEAKLLAALFVKSTVISYPNVVVLSAKVLTTF
jgi:hypothetical protein